MNVPVGTWMGAVKVNNKDVWNDYVKTGKVKGFSIEGYFADKMERPKDSVGLAQEKTSEEILNQIKQILIGDNEELKKPCWDGYEQYGTKIKDGKEVPNCIPQK